MAVFDGIDADLQFTREIPKLGAEVWRSLRADGSLPTRGDIDPTKLPGSVLPHVLLIDIEEGNVRRFRWRLIGTHITNVLGRDSTGRYVDEVLQSEDYDSFIEPLNWVIDNRRPLRIWGRATHADKNWVPFENFIAPLVDERDRIVMLFGVAYYVEPQRRV